MSPLHPAAYTVLPLGAVRPHGWAETVLRTQADGLTGHLDEFWPDVAESGWIGGEEEGWERAPYWLDGLVPLAWLLDDHRLKAKAHRWVNEILDRQHDDGWFGDRHDRSRGGSRPGGARLYDFAMDPWPRFILLKVLIQYESATADERILPAVERFLRCLESLLRRQPLRSWGRMRWADGVQSIYWYIERSGETWPLAIVDMLAKQGFDWRHRAERFPYWTRVDPSEIALDSHGPNNAMGVKAGAMLWRRSGDRADAVASRSLLDALDRYHGQANGMFSCDEHLAGRGPVQGSELCAVTELMYSLETVGATLGELDWFDRLEFLAFNALPATISADMWTHQYDQQVNQVQCVVAEERVYTSNGPDANLFGLEPHFGCCTANMHQGWPKFVHHAWMVSNTGNLVVMSLIPSRVDVHVGGVHCTGSVDTTYPFGYLIVIHLNTAGGGMTIDIRIPGWAKDAVIRVDHREAVKATPGGMFTVFAHEGVPLRVEIELPPVATVVERSEASIAITRGPLLYALPLDATWIEVVHRETVSDYELHTSTDWAISLPSSVAMTPVAQDHASSVFGPVTFDALDVDAEAIGSWPIEQGSAAPIERLDRRSIGRTRQLRLIPYGLTALRIGEFPLTDA